MLTHTPQPVYCALSEVHLSRLRQGKNRTRICCGTSASIALPSEWQVQRLGCVTICITGIARFSGSYVLTARLESQERYSRKTEAADLQRAFTILDSKRDGKIDASELGQLFRRLGHKFTKVSNTSCNPIMIPLWHL